MSNQVVVSGIGVPDNAIAFPSGQITEGEPGSNLYAFLASANASFGFNLTPHKMDMEFIPVPRDEPIFHGASGQLPAIGTFLEMFIENFYFRGRVAHSDYASSQAGTIVTISLEDDRKSLDNIKIHTEDTGESVSGIVSVGRAFRVLNGLTDEDANVVDALVFEYNKILSQGATYSQILAAIQLAIDEGDINNFSINQIPSLSELEANIGGTVESLRFKLNMSPLSQAITNVLQDSAYDWYWNMNTQSIALVNKKIAFNISEADLLGIVNEVTGFSDISDATSRMGFGQDATTEPTRVRLLGGRQQGFINSDLLSEIDGLDTSELDGNIVFTPAWGNISVGFYDADGYYRTYTPTDKELQMALAGIEQWTYFKIYQTETAANGGYDLPADAGSTAAQHETFESRFDPNATLADLVSGDPENSIRFINNRRDENHNWVLDFYNRILNHAQRHFGRSYVASNVVFNEQSGMFRPIDAAWCNIENQIEGQEYGVNGSPGPFVEDYKINSRYGPVSPFVTDDFRVGKHVVLPADTAYGSQGDQPPAGFTDWTEDAPPFNPSGDSKHYVPCDIQVVGKKVINPRSSDLYGFEDYADGTLWVQLPIIAGSMTQDSILVNLATLIESLSQLDVEGFDDYSDPTMLIEPYQSLSGVAIPVEARVRYGQTFPSGWVQGDTHYQRGEEVMVDDAFVPWGFFPIGNSTSLEIMHDRAMRKVQGRVVDRVFSRYADLQQVGLPALTFDSFASQEQNSDGLYGERSHGVTELTLRFDGTGYTTRYKATSYFASFGREAPLGERLRTELDGIIHPIDFTELANTDNIPGDAIYDAPTQSPPDIPSPPPSNEKTVKAVEITDVYDVFTATYLGDPSKGPTQETYEADGTSRTYCIDGFLNVGDDALYHVNRYYYDHPIFGNGSYTVKYFSGGRSFGNATVVKIHQANESDPNTYDVILTGNEGRALPGVAVLGAGSVVIGASGILSVADNSQVKPGTSNPGVYLYAQSEGGIPVEIESIVNAGTAQAVATVRKINSSLSPDVPIPSEGHPGSATETAIPFPSPAHARVGDQGLLATLSDGQKGVFIARIPLRSE